jgi:hypothetical protein
MVPSKKKHDEEKAGANPAKSGADPSGLLTPHEAAVLRFLYMGYVGLLVSDKEALSGLEAKGFAQYLMGGWLLTSQGKAYAKGLELSSKVTSGNPNGG